MSWRGRNERHPRWGEDRREGRPRSPVWEARRSPSPRDRRQRDRHDNERRDRHDRDSDRHEKDTDRHERDSDRYRRDRYDRPRDRDRERRGSPRRQPVNEEDIPTAPSPPTISTNIENKSSNSSSRSCSRERDERQEEALPVNASPGDWFCKCGLFNFKRRQYCYRLRCNGKRSEGILYGERNATVETLGITKRILLRRLDALTTEEKILESIKERCSKEVLNSIVGITVGRETLTGASKCLAYITFNTIAESTAAHSELLHLDPSLRIDGRDVKISYYNDPKKPQKPANNEYAGYYPPNVPYTQPLSEADRVNAAAAVAQSAISAAQARQMSWAPVAAPTFVASTAQVTPKPCAPIGDGKTVYNPPDVRTFMYDETSGYYYDPNTGLYYDGNTQYFFNSQTNQYMYWDATTCTYMVASQNQQNTEQPKLPNPSQPTVENTIAKEPEEKKKKDKEDKVKVAKKIAKDMERWARTLNQKKENARSNIVMEQVLDTSASKGSADIGFSVLGAGPSISTHVRELSPPPPDDFLLKKVTEPVEDNDEGIIDWIKLTCLLCKRKFPSHEVLNKHKTLSELHKQNLAEYNKKNDLLPQINGYRDRAAERRMKFGEDETPVVQKRFNPIEIRSVPVAPHPPPSVVDTIGGKMLQKMGWSAGRGLGKTEQGRIAPIEAEQRPSLVGLGQKKGIYTPTPGETYRDTVKKLMIARYKEVVGQEDGS